MSSPDLKELLRARSPEFWEQLFRRSVAAVEFEELFRLLTLRKKAIGSGFAEPASKSPPLRVAMIGGCSLYPLHELLEHLLAARGIDSEFFVGDYDSYVSEIMEPGSRLYEFRPQVVVLIPSDQRCRYAGKLTDSRETVQTAAAKIVGGLLDLGHKVHERTQTEMVLVNLTPPAGHDPGAIRVRTLASDWSFRKLVNLELGLNAPAYVHICDREFLATRRGAVQARDDRGWFESKQPGSPALLADLSQELAHLIACLRQSPKKVLVLDLDNTLWGGVVADDGLEGIEIGHTSPRGEAFQAFQRYILSLKDRGVLLAVCSKNDHATASAPFEKHPEMLLRAADFVSFKANWEPKSENIRRMAADLNLGLDSFAFVDDNPAEIEIVRQFAPEVSGLCLGADPAQYVGLLQDARWFEPRAITGEDAQRTEQYRSEAQREELRAAVTDMDTYLESLEMTADISEFTSLDIPRLTQLINKSNQFNLTTRRRTEAEVQQLVADTDYINFSLRLQDRFGDHGLVGIIIGRVRDKALEIDTWVMSCRVLKRQVEEEMVNEFMRLAAARGCVEVRGIYLPTEKNEMVRVLYLRMGFQLVKDQPDRRDFIRDVRGFQPTRTKIQISRKAYEPN